MPLDFNKRIGALQTRRSAAKLALDSASPWAVRKAEKYEERSTGKATRYALGAMQEVDSEYTRAGITAADRVKAQLAERLGNRGIGVTFEDQGSVPLNVHIRGVSDVDFLVLHAGFLRLDWNGPLALAGHYVKLPNSPIGDMITLRRSCERALIEAYPAADVDTSGSKSIAITGGSLRRKVDVVPAHWFDSAQYQRTGLKRDRSVSVLDKDVPELLENRPFLYMAEISAKDDETSGGAKKLIRLLKNLRSDSDYKIELTSYDIGSLLWNMESTRLNVAWFQEISLIGTALDYFRRWSVDERTAKGLITPDYSRVILDEPSKFQSLIYLTRDIEELASEVAQEFQPLTKMYPTAIPRVLADAVIM